MEGYSAITLRMLVLSQRHCDSKHADNTVHGAILPPHCAASWEGDKKNYIAVCITWRYKVVTVILQLCHNSITWTQ